MLTEPQISSYQVNLIFAEDLQKRLYLANLLYQAGPAAVPLQLVQDLALSLRHFPLFHILSPSGHINNVNSIIITISIFDCILCSYIDFIPKQRDKTRPQKIIVYFQAVKRNRDFCTFEMLMKNRIDQMHIN